MPTFCIANERLADEKGVVLRRFAWKAARENDRNKNLYNIVRDRHYVKLRHVGFEMPRPLVIFLEPSGDRIAPSGFDAARKPEHAGRIPEHGFHIVRVMRILRSNEFCKEGPCRGFVRGSGCVATRCDYHEDNEESCLDRRIAHGACKSP